MLNGIDPIIIITLYNKGAVDLLSGIPFASEVANLIGLPIPIYLSEQFTQIAVVNETRSIVAATKVDPAAGKDPLSLEELAPTVSQTALDSDVNIDLVAAKGSILVSSFIALFEMVFARLVSADYGITYINGSTVIFNALLQRFATNIDPNEDLIKIDLSLSNAKKESPTPKAGIPSVPRIPGALRP